MGGAGGLVLVGLGVRTLQAILCDGYFRCFERIVGNSSLTGFQYNDRMI